MGTELLERENSILKQGTRTHKEISKKHVSTEPQTVATGFEERCGRNRYIIKHL
jgi:hypothetical protein